MKAMLIMLLLISVIGCKNDTKTVDNESDAKNATNTNTNSEKTSSRALVGGWAINEDMQEYKLPKEVESAFNEAMVTGTTYIPVLYLGYQLVSGRNYMFICKEILSTQAESESIVQMTIYKPLNGTAKITEIKPIFN